MSYPVAAARGRVWAPVTQILILDQFTDSNGTGLAAHTIAPTNVPATSWTVDAGAITIQSNKATIASENTSHAAYVFPNVSDVVVSANITTGNTSGDNDLNILLLRYTDSNNKWIVEIGKRGGVSSWQIRERDTGVEVQRASGSYTYAAQTTYAIEATASGSTISATRDGGTEISYASATFNQSVKNHGINLFISSNQSAYQTLDDYQITG